MTADERTVPAHQRSRTDDQQRVGHLPPLHADAGEHQRQPVTATEMRTFAQSPTQDQYLLAESEDLSVSIIPEEAQDE